MPDRRSTVTDQLNELSACILAFNTVFQGLEATVPTIGRRVRGSLNLLSAVFDEQCSLLLASTIGRRLKAIANAPEHHCDVYRSLLATRESMVQTPEWNAILTKYPAILSPIDRFLYIYQCPGCQPDPKGDCNDALKAALAQVSAQVAWHKAHKVYLRPVHECLLRMRDWMRANLRPGLLWHERAQQLADRYALLDSWSCLCCSAVYANVWRLLEMGLYADSAAASMFLLHQNTEEGRYLHSGFLRNFGKLRACYLGGAFTWEKFALILQRMEAQVAARSADAPAATDILRRTARRYKRLLKVFARTFDTDALYLYTDQLLRQEADTAARLPQLPPFDDAKAEENAESDSPLMELQHYLTGAGGWPGRLRGAADAGTEQGDSRSPALGVSEATDHSKSRLRTLRLLHSIPHEILLQILDSGDSLVRLMQRLERHLRLVIDCLEEVPSHGKQLSVEQRALRNQVEEDANLLLGVLAKLMRLAAERFHRSQPAI